MREVADNRCRECRECQSHVVIDSETLDALHLDEFCDNRADSRVKSRVEVATEQDTE